MSGFSVKRVNVVGAFASLWAFIFAFFPFYRIEPMEVLFRPYVLGNKSEAALNPLEGLVGTAKASYTKQMAAHMHMKNTVSSERPEQSSETSDEKI